MARIRGKKLDIHCFQVFDGNKIHCTLEFEGRRYAVVLFSLGKSYEETPALARAFLQKLGFPLPTDDFQAQIDRKEHLAELAIQGHKEDEAGRHAPPGRRQRRPETAPSALWVLRSRNQRSLRRNVLVRPKTNGRKNKLERLR